MEVLWPFLVTLFAWVLAVLGSRPALAIRNFYQRRAVRRTVSAELWELRYRMALWAFNVAGRHGRIDHDFLEWSATTVNAYRGVRFNPDMERNLLEMRNLTPEALQAVQGRETTAHVMKRQEVPLTERALSEIALFPIEVQRQIVDLLASLRQFNEEIERNWQWNIRTFDSMSEENHRRIQVNFESSVAELGRQAQEIVDRIAQVVNYCDHGHIEEAVRPSGVAPAGSGVPTG